MGGPASRLRLVSVPGPERWLAVTLGILVVVEGGLAWRLGWTASLAAYLVLGAVLTVAAVVDARTSRVPNVLVLPAYPIGVGLLGVAAGVEGQWWPLARALLAMAGVVAFYLALALVAGGRQMGLGDVTAGGLTGLLLGWVGWPAVEAGVLLSWAIALVAVVVLRHRARGRVAALPAVPFLWLGALVVILATR